jgi:iron complex outermembrane recepter protein
MHVPYIQTRRQRSEYPDAIDTASVSARLIPSTLSIAIATCLYGGPLMSGSFAQPADDALDEVVVTARKRRENLQEVPQNIDVFTSRDLQNLSITNFQDFALLAPSISAVSIGPDNQRFFIRGASDGSGPTFGTSNVSTNGYLLDDVSLDFYGHAPDLHLYDIERIEVLNGPQGTLFGASAMSGAVRLVTKKPDPGAFSAGVDVDGGHLEGGANNWTYEGFANIPLVAGLSAVRLSAYSEYDGGYIDNLDGTRHWLNGTTSTNAAWAGSDFNRQDVVGGRIALLQNFADDWRATLTGYFQRQRFRGLWEENPAQYGPNNLQLFSPQGGYEYDQFLDLHVDGNVGIADLVYAGGYSSQRRRRLYDFSDYAQYSSYASFVQGSACKTSPIDGTGSYGGCNVPYMYGVVSGVIQKWSNEVRLQSKSGGRTHWTLGVYWEKTADPYSGVEVLPGINFSGAQARNAINAYGNLASPVAHVYYEEYAVFDYIQTSEFGDLTFDLDDRWSVEGGIVHFHGSTSELASAASYYYQQIVPVLRGSSDQKTSFKAGVNFKPTDHALLYFAFAQGFRDGGFNYVDASDASKYPSQFKPDTLNNYEVGLKSTWLGGRIVWNSALYYMRWSDYQIGVSVIGPPFGFNANVGDVRIYGLESGIQARPFAGLQLSFTGNYNDSKLVSNDYQSADFVVTPGERLPEAPYFNFNAVSRYERPIAGSLAAFVQVDVGHKGDMWNNLNQADHVLQPAYTIGNLRFGLERPDAGWQVEGYISNLWNTRAVIFADYSSWFPQDVPSPPRVFGMRLKYRWGKPD